ncbi:MAG: crossover junction endodeoxyribonuclease RuvC [Xanthomonadaceae bacterium]|nr:crossover junction endodeoxyribonuclease RuvC [Xanthomonadaceae bacterium]
MRILGVDPGSRFLGYAVISDRNILTHGTLIEKNGEMSDRLFAIYTGLKKIIQEFNPEVLAVEKIFFAKNALSALKLGEIRGVILLAGAEAGIPIFEYAPNEIKKSITGHGHADKQTVSHWIKVFTGETEFKTNDASDALAIALCHASHSVSASGGNKIAPKKGRSGGMANALKHRIKFDGSDKI